MPANIQVETNGTLCAAPQRQFCNKPNSAKLRIRLAHEIDAGVKPRVLAILEDPRGWERGAEWGNLELLSSHSPEIAKIAIVGEPRWESEAMAFADAGFRRAPMKFFPVRSPG